MLALGFEGLGLGVCGFEGLGFEGFGLRVQQTQFLAAGFKG